MNKFAPLLAASLLLSAGASAQVKPQPCGFDYVLDYYRKADPKFQQRMEDSYAEASKLSSKNTAGVYRIPVVFHVLYNTQDQNLHDSVILSQLQILNDAYRHKHKDVGNIRGVFQPFAGDAEIEFYLPTQDPDGKPSNGITRTQTNIAMFANLFNDPTIFNSLERIKSTTNGGHDAWPTHRYLNIWVADMRDSTLERAFLYGYAAPPLNPLPPNWNAGQIPAITDGVVVHSAVVGNNNPTNNGAYGKDGKTMVHEVGHYLGLRHIWGDAASISDTCSADDGIADTPPQAEASDPSVPCAALAMQNTCGSHLAGDLPDMWENYMDYSSNSCQVMFTAGQVTHMRSIMENQRAFLKAPLSIKTPSLFEETFSLYPQPASGNININYAGDIERIAIIDLLGKEVWNANGEQSNNRVHDVLNLPPGTYIITLQSQGQKLNKRLIINK